MTCGFAGNPEKPILTFKNSRPSTSNFFVILVQKIIIPSLYIPDSLKLYVAQIMYLKYDSHSIVS